MGWIKYLEGNHSESENYYHESLQIGNVLNNRRSIAWSNGGLGLIAREQGAYQKAKKFFMQTYDYYQSIGYKNMAGIALNQLGRILLLMDKTEEAKEHHLKALDIFEDIAKQDGIVFSISYLGDVAFEMGEYERAKEHYGEVLELFKNLEGQTGITIGYFLCDLGKVAVATGDEHEAQSKFRDALQIGVHNHNERLCLAVLGALSALLTLKGEVERAIEVSSLAASHPEGDAFIRENVRNRLVDLEGILPLGDFNAAQKRGRALDLWIAAEQILTELGG